MARPVAEAVSISCSRPNSGVRSWGNLNGVPGYSSAAEDDDAKSADAVVLASGNLGLISFPDIDGRATLEQLAERHPHLVQSLAEHPGIGFVLVRSETLGAIVVGGHGIHYLQNGHFDGLEPFGRNAGAHVRRTDSFRNTPDILVNSFYDPDIDEGAAFEEQIGFHGGMGDKQAEPFLLYPDAFSVGDEPIVGASAVHHLFKSWMESATT